MLRSNKGFSGIELLVVLFVVAIFGGGAYLYWQGAKEESKEILTSTVITDVPTQTSTVSVEPSLQPTVTPVLDPTPAPPAGWKAYENAEYGFSLYYPSGFEDRSAEREDPTEVFSAVDPSQVWPASDKPVDGIRVRVEPLNQSFYSYIESKKQELIHNTIAFTREAPVNPQERSLLIDGVASVVLIDYSWDGIDRYYLPLESQGVVLEVGHLRQSVGSFSEFEQVISTFQLK